MLRTLSILVKDNWEWRSQIVKLARFELLKQTRGTALGVFWFFAKPAVYLFCFWFALEIGWRAGRSVGGDAPFIFWLMAGIVPWFFMSRVLSTGSDVLTKYRNLVQRIKFPLSCISTMFVLSVFILQLAFQAIVLAVYFICGQPLDIHLVQIPFLLAVFFLFWVLASISFSQLSAMSRDFAQFLKAMRKPLFWLSGVIFNIQAIPVEALRNALLFNPITFFVSAFRDIYFYRTWIWEEPVSLACFAFVFILTFCFTMLVYKKFHKEVPDVI